MNTLLLLLAIGQAKPGPIDAYRANLAAARVRTRFTCDLYANFPDRSILKRLEGFAPGPGPAAPPWYIAEGRWDFDGTCDHYVNRLVGGSKYDPKIHAGLMIPCEVIWDGTTYAYHYLFPGEDVLHVEVQVSQLMLHPIGPLTWWAGHRIDRAIEVKYAGVEPERKSRTLGGRWLEAEIYYKKREPDFISRLEVAYDPAVGYLPRYVRSIGYGTEPERRDASVTEFYLIDAQPCPAGGFVPTEWYLAGYHIDDFHSKYPDYSDETRLTPSDAPSLTHLKVTKIEDQKGPVQLDEMQGVSMVMAPGGPFSKKGGLPNMSMAEMKKLLGKRMVRSNVPMVSNIDYAELHEFDRPRSRTPWLAYLMGGLGLLALLWFSRAWKRGKALLLLALLPLAQGCGRNPIPLLTAAFTPARLIYDSSRPSMKLNLEVNNAGNRTLQIFSVDAGCACRPIDTSRLPTLLRPGESLGLTMGLGGGLSPDPQTFLINFHTDHGKLTAQAHLLALADHFLTPQSVTLPGLYEGGAEHGESFEMVHRQIHDPSGERAATSLVPPSEFVMEKVATQAGRVAGAPEYAYEDTTYRLTLKDRSLGLHRAGVLLRTGDGHKIAETPIVWERLPYLSSTPSRVALSSRPVRAFVRCPDEGVELVRVMSSPAGVRAVLGSPREVVISPAAQAPAVIDGVVEVETTAKGRGPLRIPVVRYAPMAAKS